MNAENKKINTYTYDELEVGMTESFSKVVTKEYVDAFRHHTGDINPLHSQEDFAKEKGFDTSVVFGMLTASYLSTLAGVYLPGKNSLIHSTETMFLKPVFVGDKLTIIGKVKKKNDTFKYIDLGIDIRNQHDVKVVKAKMRIGIIDE